MFFNRRIFLGLATAGMLGALPIMTQASFAAPATNNKLSSAMNTGFSVVANGAPQAVIVTPQNPSGVVKYAAQELQQHIERATGVRLEVLPEQNAAASPLPHRIYVGPSAATQAAGIRTDDLSLNGFHTKTTPNAAYLVGNDNGGMPTDPATLSYSRSWAGFEFGAPPLDDSASMGSLFAVYDWLENQAGVRWLWPGEQGTIVPKTQTLFGGAIGEQTVNTPMIHSRPRISLTGWPGQTPAVREKYIYDTNVWLRRQRFARGVSFHYGHAYTQYWERHGSTHPEYFAMRPDGKREPFSTRTQLVQMCVSNPALHKQIIADWLVQRKEKPSLPWINGVENDKTANDPACTCEVCRSWDAKTAAEVKKNPWLSGAETGKQETEKKVSLSDRYAKFWLALQEEGKKHDPNATVLGYAYADYSAPPVETKLNKNIIVGIVPSYSFPVEEKDREAFRVLWDGWAKTGARLYLRPNYFLVGYAMPYIFAEQFGEEYKYAAANGMIGTDFDSLVGMWGAQGPNLYMMGRLNAKPELSVAQVLDEYYSGFGPAAKPVREYFTHWKAVTDKFDSEFRAASKGGWAHVSKSGHLNYTPETFATGRTFLQQAKQAAANDAEVLQRVAFLELWLDHAELSMKALSAFHAQRENPKDAQLKQAFDDAKTAVDKFREVHEAEIANVGLLRQVEVWSGWRKSSEIGK